MKRPLVLLFLLAPAGLWAAPFSLDEAVLLAAEHSKAGQLAKLKVEEASASLEHMRSERYPLVSLFGTAAYTPKPLELTLPSGSLNPLLGTLAPQLGLGAQVGGLGPVPQQDLRLWRGSKDIYVGGVLLLQPLSQQWRIGSGVTAARAEQEASRREAARVSAQIRYAVEELYVGLQVEARRADALRAKLASQRAKLLDAEHANVVGELLDDAVLGLQAELTQAETALARSEQQRTRLGLQLADLIGRPGQTVTELEPLLPERPVHPLEHWLSGVEHNPERRVAVAMVEKAVAGQRASRQAHIPDLSLFATGIAQDGADPLPTSTGFVGVVLKWDILDFGRRGSDVRKSSIQRRQAELNRDRIEEEASRQVRSVYLDFGHAGELVQLAGKAADYRRRAAQLVHQSVSNGLALESKALAADAELAEAEADLFAARSQRHLALLRLYWLTGEL